MGRCGRRGGKERGGRRRGSREGEEEGEGEGCPCGVFELAKSCRCQFAEPKLTTSTNHQRVKTIFTLLIFKHFLQPSLNDCDPTPIEAVPSCQMACAEL